MRRFSKGVALCLVAVLALVSVASAHFAMIIPSKDVVGKEDKKEIGILVQFTHPFEGGPIMQMDKPEKFGVVMGDKGVDLLGTLKEKKVDGKSTWETDFKITRPADYVFFLVPKPYWEPAEDKFIVHVTKVIVDALGAEEGWDKPIAATAGIPAEIVPMTRPYSLYAGNSFTGQVLKDGKPVARYRGRGGILGQGKDKGSDRFARRSGGQDGRERHLFLFHAQGRLVGLCRADGGRKASAT